MTTADLVNRIIAKLHPQSEVKFWRIAEYAVEFAFAEHEYLAQVIFVDGKYKCQVLTYLGDTNNYTIWIEGVLNGLVRDDAGMLS